MNRCKTCKHWVKTCEHWVPFAHNNWGQCQHPKLYENQHGESEEDEVHGDRDGQDIATGPRFGCVHHEEKEET